MGRLPDYSEALIICRLLEALTPSEVAEITGTKPNIVRVHRTKCAHLEQFIKEHGADALGRLKVGDIKPAIRRHPPMNCYDLLSRDDPVIPQSVERHARMCAEYCLCCEAFECEKCLMHTLEVFGVTRMAVSRTISERCYSLIRLLS